MSDMANGSIERQIHIEASPQLVYEVISSPEHVARWWFDEADFEPTPGSIGVLATGAEIRVPMAVVEAVPGVRFSFRWVAPPAPAVDPEGAALTAQNSVLITFDLAPDSEGTLLTVIEQVIPELAWDAVVLDSYSTSHDAVWDQLLAALPAYVASVAGGVRR